MKNTLEAFNLRHTACREAILELFSEHTFALSHSDLEERIGKQFDRVTIYRTLKTFLEKGILHKVLDEGGMKYALCKELCSHDHHHHDHVHFKCTTCGQTTCIQELHIPAFVLPSGYQPKDINLLIQGICPSCSV